MTPLTTLTEKEATKAPSPGIAGRRHTQADQPTDPMLVSTYYYIIILTHSKHHKLPYISTLPEETAHKERQILKSSSYNFTKENRYWQIST